MAAHAKLQRTPSTGKVKRGPSTGKLPRSSSGNSTCCCKGSGCMYCTTQMHAGISLHIGSRTLCSGINYIILRCDTFGVNTFCTYAGMEWTGIASTLFIAECIPYWPAEPGTPIGSSCCYRKVMAPGDLNLGITTYSPYDPSDPWYTAPQDVTDRMQVTIEVCRHQGLWRTFVLLEESWEHRAENPEAYFTSDVSGNQVSFRDYYNRRVAPGFPSKVNESNDGRDVGVCPRLVLFSGAAFTDPIDPNSTDCDAIHYGFPDATENGEGEFDCDELDGIANIDDVTTTGGFGDIEQYDAYCETGI